MASELWNMPVPATALLEGPLLTTLPKRCCELSFDIEGQEGEPNKVRLLFEGVEAYKCTYLTSCHAEMFKAAYGKLVRRGTTPWLAELSKVYEGYCESAHVNPQRLQHLMICFDDGPCYEIICTGFRPD